MSDTSPPASRRILVVDDNAINRRLAMAFVKRLGFATEEVEDGASALAKLASSPFDVVFLDISMPGMSGEEVLARLRADPRFSGLHIIAYTAHAMEIDRQRYLAGGFDAVITKPITIGGLHAVVGHAPND